MITYAANEGIRPSPIADALEATQFTKAHHTDTRYLQLNHEAAPVPTEEACTPL